MTALAFLAAGLGLGAVTGSLVWLFRTCDRADRDGHVHRRHRPAPLRRRVDLDNDPIWATPAEPAESPAELQAMRGLRARYTAAYEQLLNDATGNPLTFPPSPGLPPQVAEANEGDPSRG